MTGETILPPNESEFRLEWQGSQIVIPDVDSLIEAASAKRTSIYRGSDFPYGIDSIDMTMQVNNAPDYPVLVLQSILALHNDPALSLGDIIRLFHDRFAVNARPRTSDSAVFLQDNNFSIAPSDHDGAFSMADVASKANYVMNIYEDEHKHPAIVISNQLFVSESRHQLVEQIAPDLHAIDPVEHIASLAKMTIKVADFINGFEHEGFRNPSHKEWPLKRVYELKPLINGRHLLASTALEAVRHPASEPTKELTEEELINQYEKDFGLADEEGTKTYKQFHEIGGLFTVKKQLQEIAVAFSHPEIMEKWGVTKPRAVLLYGPPGTGKTTLVEALAGEMNATLVPIRSSDIYEKWIGQSEENIEKIFNHAEASTEPLVLFFDEFESVIRTNIKGDATKDSVAGIFKQRMNTLTQNNPNVLVVAATNNRDAIDPALIRSGRFDYQISVPLPTERERTDILISLVSDLQLENGTDDFQLFENGIHYDRLATLGTDLTGADYVEILRRIRMSKAMEEIHFGSPASLISEADIEQAITEFRR